MTAFYDYDFSGTVDVLIEDINDNAPVIRHVGMIELVESSTIAPDSVLTRLTVIDADQNSQLEFRISNNPDSAFSIDSYGNL